MFVITLIIIRGLQSSSQLKRAQERECIIPKRIVTGWFLNNYATRNLKFEMYKIETVTMR
ncbi:hypothetical protein IGI04_039219 [Brassica rapa subsp. trilocularis]|uniref:Uncharacterized protein n=1 Tax=Brassica rapa subsp. trilocularis TaxID=1813537 RepID=A0ABQ7KNQ8_BRACM|nr:hypothetical protein IGI04_039219 [Brassica rapa subsp. trilocularis]